MMKEPLEEGCFAANNMATSDKNKEHLYQKREERRRFCRQQKTFLEPKRGKCVYFLCTHVSGIRHSFLLAIFPSTTGGREMLVKHEAITSHRPPTSACLDI